MKDVKVTSDLLWERYSGFWAEARHKRIARGDQLFMATCPTPEGGGPEYLTTCRDTPHSFSAVFDPGVRTYAFTNEADRDAFVAKYSGAEACEDPMDD